MLWNAVVMLWSACSKAHVTQRASKLRLRSSMRILLLLLSHSHILGAHVQWNTVLCSLLPSTNLG